MSAPCSGGWCQREDAHYAVTRALSNNGTWVVEVFRHHKGGRYATLTSRNYYGLDEAKAVAAEERAKNRWASVGEGT